MKLRDEEYYQELFYDHVNKTDHNGCWLWTAAKNNIGYGMFRYQNKMQLAHRVQAKFQNLNITDKLVIHTCNNYDCVNPNHLVVGDQIDKGKIVRYKETQRVPRKLTKKSKCKYCGVEHFNNIIGRDHNEKCRLKPSL
jgi:hypothetical protein